MTKRQSAQYEMFARVRTFGEKHKDAFLESPVAEQAFASVAAAADQLAKKAVARMSKAREGQLKKKAARVALAGQLKVVARTARAIARTSPGFDEPFKQTAVKTAQALLTTAKVFIEEAEPRAKQFLQHGLPETFVAELKDLVAALERAVVDRAAGKSDVTEAQANIDAAVKAGVEAVRTLDVIIANHFRHDPAVLAAWRGDSKVDAGRKPAKAAAKTDAAKTPPETAATEPGSTAAAPSAGEKKEAA